MSSSWILVNLRTIVADLTIYNNFSYTLNTIESFKWRIEIIYRELLAIEVLNGHLMDHESSALECLEKAYQIFSNLMDRLLSLPSLQQALLMRTGSVGRPSFDISPHQLEYLIENQFSVPQIAQMLGVSISTIRRRMSTFDLSIRSTYTTFTNEQLDEIVSVAQQEHLNWGNRQMYGHLISQGVRVPFHRVREAQRRIDPQGSVMRRLRSLSRRCYSVPGPQHLWHIDGNHKLIK